MKKVLPKYQINYILKQLIAFTFLCIMAFLNYFIEYEITFIEISVIAFTTLTLIIYESIIVYHYNKIKKNPPIEEEQTPVYNERFLWFELVLLFDILIIVALVTQLTKNYFNVAYPITIGFLVFYLVSVIIKPYFGIKNNK